MVERHDPASGQALAQMLERPNIAEAEFEHGALNLRHLRADLIENVALCGQPADETLEATHMRLYVLNQIKRSAMAATRDGSRVKPEGNVLNPDRASPHIEANDEHCSNRTGCRQGSYRVVPQDWCAAELRCHL